MDALTQRVMDKFWGINNVDPATRLFPITVDRSYVYPLQEAHNVEIDNGFGISSRTGRTEVLTGTDIHSLWSDGLSGYYVDGSSLYKIDSIGTKTLIRSGMQTGALVSYRNVNDKTYYTNKYQIGYILKDTDTAFADPSLEFKESLPAGQLIESFLGCLYVAVNNILYISDPLCNYYDTRAGYRIFKDNITMIRAIDEEGIYVADSEVWFLKGKSNEDFDRQSVYPKATIPFTDVVIPGQYIDDTLTSDVVMWTAEDGIIMGDGDGKVVNLTKDKYFFNPTGRGTAFVRNVNNVRHYINSLY